MSNPWKTWWQRIFCFFGSHEWAYNGDTFNGVRKICLCCDIERLNPKEPSHEKGDNK